MSEHRRLLASIFLGVLLLPGISFAQANEQSGFCNWMGWLVRPFGGCEVVEREVEIVTHERDVVAQTPPPAAPVPQPPPEPQPPVIIEYSTTTQPIIQEITNEYVTIEQSGVSEALLNQRVTELLMYINSLPHGVSQTDTTRVVEVRATDGVTREYLLDTIDNVTDDIRDVRDDFEEGAEFLDPSLTNAALAGVSYALGSFGIGTTSPSDVLAVAGSVYLAETTPTNPNNRLYNFGGDLYWDGTLVTGSTTANWSAAAGNVFRLSGGAGIGTSTVTETLTVDGTARFTGTTTAPLVDTGGQVCDVRAYGAVGDNSTINDAAIAAAIADCGEGGTVYFPMGEFRISSPIVLDTPVTLRGAYSPRWSYSSTPRSSIRADFGSFSGVAVIHVRDRTISGEPEDNNGGRIEHISIDGGSASTDVTGVLFEGLVRDWKLTDVDISQMTGNGFEAAVGAGSGNPRGFTIRGLSIYSADGHGFRATALNDSYIDDLLAVGNALRGIYLSSMGETKIANSRSVFNALEGLYIDGSSNNGGISFTDFSTDRNQRHGVRISASGTSTIIFNGLLTRRDGPNTNGGSETPYAGVAIIGSTTEKVAPVFISGLGQTVGVDDVGNPPLSPSVGVRVTNAEYVKIDGQLWGVDDAWIDGGGNDFFIIEDDAILKTGTAGAQELFTNERKWQSTSTDELFFGNRVSIGSSTDSRLFNIVAPSQVGFRLRDTTNNVTMDARVEDFQAFIGTFSNHQMRFQTNNTSRLTIDLDGDIGIGTTSPTARLTVAGDVRFASTTGGTLETDALGNVTVSSDERLKDVLGAYEAGLDEVLGLEPILYRWNEESGYDQATTYAGFSAQNVEDFLPEAVGENGNGYKTLSTRPILASVVTAIQELWQTVTGNQRRITELEARIETLERTLDIEPPADENGEPAASPAVPPAEEESESADTAENTDGAGSDGASDESKTLPGDTDEPPASSTPPVGPEESASSTDTPEPAIPAEAPAGGADSEEDVTEGGETSEESNGPEAVDVPEESESESGTQAEEVLDVSPAPEPRDEPQTLTED